MKVHSNMTPDEAKDGGGNNSEAERGSTDGAGSGTNRAGGANPAEDFSEFMWMENEEEFDEQVLRELEDEEILNFYMNLTEAENEAEAEAAALQANNGGGTPAASQPRNEDALVSEVTAGLNQLGFASRLNPNAQEFVPQPRQQQYQSNSVPVSESGGS